MVIRRSLARMKVIALDSGCGNYEQLWCTTSLRGNLILTLRASLYGDSPLLRWLFRLEPRTLDALLAAADVLTLIGQIQDRVEERFGLRLVREVHLIGDVAVAQS